MNPPASASTGSPPSVENSPFYRDRLPPGVGLPAKGDPGRLGVYRIVGRITRDAVGTVLLGVDSDGAPAALRLVPAELADAPDVRSRLTAEVGRLVRVRTLCTADYRGADVRAAEPWLATAYVPGRTLAEHVAKHGPLTGGMLTALATGLAESLAAGHAVGATHLALDPTKVILSPDGPKVVDLGIARATGKPIAASHWAAPEQGGGPDTEAATVTGYADVFAWGALVRFAATGWEPSGNTVDEPELGAVPPRLAPLVRRALVTDPERRPTALQLLQELTEGKGEDLAEAVSALLAAEWTGVTAPEPRRVSRVRKPALLTGTAVVLVAALLGGWAVLRPGADPDSDPDQADTTAAEDAVVEETEEPSGPTVAEAPEAVDAVVAEAVELALGAPSFTTYEHFHNNGGGDSAPRTYFYTEAPEPTISRTSYLGITGDGVVVSGPDLGDYTYFTHYPAGVDGEERREYYRDPDSQSEPAPPVRDEWEELVDLVASGSAEDADIVYQGVVSVPYEFPYLTEEMVGDEDPAERSGHHYSGDTVFEVRNQGLEPVDYDLWISEEGRPIYVEVHLRLDEVSELTGEPVTFTHMVDFARFGGAVEIEIPEESEIHPERP